MEARKKPGKLGRCGQCVWEETGQPGWPFVFLYFCVFAFFVFLRGLSSKLLLKGPFIFLLTSLTYILLWHKVCVRRNQPASLYICIFVNKEFNFYIVPKYIFEIMFVGYFFYSGQCMWEATGQPGWPFVVSYLYIMYTHIKYLCTYLHLAVFPSWKIPVKENM